MIATTVAAPHIRSANSLARIQVLRAVALIPVTVAAILNTGYQYLLVLDGAAGAGDWRDRLVANLGVDFASPSVFGMLLAGLAHVLPVFLVAMLAAGMCERMFASRRRLPMTLDFLLSALVFTLLMHPAVSLVHAALGMAFGTIFGKAVFGGEGKTFLNPALLGAAVIQISFPVSLADHPLWTGLAGYSGSNVFAVYAREGAAGLAAAGVDWGSAFLGGVQGMMGATSPLAVLAGGALLVWTGIVSWRLIGGHVLGLALIAGLCSLLGDGLFALPWYWHAVLGSFAFGVVFVATDPASCACTQAGRWIQGLLAGGLVVALRVLNESHPDGVIAALLLSSMLAPLIDHVVVLRNIRARMCRHG